jgi:hypothetical protein
MSECHCPACSCQRDFALMSAFVGGRTKPRSQVIGDQVPVAKPHFRVSDWQQAPEKRREG